LYIPQNEPNFPSWPGGEGDLEAPDFCDGPILPSAFDRSFTPTDDQSRMSPRIPGNGRARGNKGEIPLTLGPKQSAALREKLVAELGNITSADWVCPAATISYWWWLGCWQHCGPAAPIPY
jgi:hypothetical protein